MWIVGTVVLLLLVLSVPIGIALSASAAAHLMTDPLLGPEVIFRAFFNFINRYTLMAIPLFIYTGYLMEKTGLIAQLFRFADALVLLAVVFFPGLATWLPDQLVVNVFK